MLSLSKHPQLYLVRYLHRISLYYGFYSTSSFCVWYSAWLGYVGRMLKEEQCRTILCCFFRIFICVLDKSQLYNKVLKPYFHGEHQYQKLQMTPSIQSRLMVVMMRLGRVKNFCHSFSKLQEKPLPIKPAKPPQSYARRYDVSMRRKNAPNAMNVWTFSSKNGKTPIKAVLYLHGGAYVATFSGIHWQFIAKLVTATNRAVVAPDYPLAPSATVKDVFEQMLPLYREMVESFGAENIAIIGDSAGGGMALALAQVFREEGLPQPAQLVLLSPWLDVSMSNDGLLALDKRDPILDIEGLKAAGEMYAGNLSVRNPRVSPMFGDCQKLAPMTFFIGTRDMFLADCREFYAQCMAQKIPLAYHEAAEMLHDWMLMPIPEAETVLREITSILR
ncbi:MAG: alpha/beta hydrolase [Candidatus Kapaibacterium sp.]|nr:MAG: alpha/beta hydrolase [Candidatus Kapabacteria bacterium]